MDADRSFGDVPITAVRDFWNARPCNIRHSPKEVGTRDYFDEVERRKYFVEGHIPAFAEFSRWKDRKVLEIGCGLGTDTISFSICSSLLQPVTNRRRVISTSAAKHRNPVRKTVSQRGPSQVR